MVSFERFLQRHNPENHTPIYIRRAVAFLNQNLRLATTNFQIEEAQRHMGHHDYQQIMLFHQLVMDWKQVLQHSYNTRCS